jgi:hypothetical protein
MMDMPLHLFVRSVQRTGGLILFHFREGVKKGVMGCNPASLGVDLGKLIFLHFQRAKVR